MSARARFTCLSQKWLKSSGRGSFNLRFAPHMHQLDLSNYNYKSLDFRTDFYHFLSKGSKCPASKGAWRLCYGLWCVLTKAPCSGGLACCLSFLIYLRDDTAHRIGSCRSCLNQQNLRVVPSLRCRSIILHVSGTCKKKSWRTTSAMSSSTR